MSFDPAQPTNSDPIQSVNSIKYSQFGNISNPEVRKIMWQLVRYSLASIKIIGPAYEIMDDVAFNRIAISYKDELNNFVTMVYKIIEPAVYIIIQEKIGEEQVQKRIAKQDCKPYIHKLKQEFESRKDEFIHITQVLTRYLQEQKIAIQKLVASIALVMDDHGIPMSHIARNLKRRIKMQGYVTDIYDNIKLISSKNEKFDTYDAHRKGTPQHEKVRLIIPKQDIMENDSLIQDFFLSVCNQMARPSTDILHYGGFWMTGEYYIEMKWDSRFKSAEKPVPPHTSTSKPVPPHANTNNKFYNVNSATPSATSTPSNTSMSTIILVSIFAFLLIIALYNKESKRRPEKSWKINTDEIQKSISQQFQEDQQRMMREQFKIMQEEQARKLREETMKNLLEQNKQIIQPPLIPSLPVIQHDRNLTRYYDMLERIKKQRLEENKKKLAELQQKNPDISPEIIKILECSPDLVELPLSVWYQHQGKILLDMTTDFWRSLRITKKEDYIRQYQEAYAKANNLLVAKTINLPTLELFAKPLVLRLIPPGRFFMGSAKAELYHNEQEGPLHRVIISTPYYLGVYECTQAQWKAVMGDNPSKFQTASQDTPVEMVSWNMIAQGSNSFCSKTGLSLPSEAQWEYACRAGSAYAYPNENTSPDYIAWYDNNSSQKTHPVGWQSPNAFGLCDMLGNVAEWCDDNMQPYQNIAIASNTSVQNTSSNKNDPPAANKNPPTSSTSSNKNNPPAANKNDPPTSNTTPNKNNPPAANKNSPATTKNQPATTNPQISNSTSNKNNPPATNKNNPPAANKLPPDHTTNLGNQVIHPDFVDNNDWPDQENPGNFVVRKASPFVFRGGSYLSPAGKTRSASRDSADPTATLDTVGFRVMSPCP